MKPCFDKSTGEVLQLLAGLNKEIIPFWNLDGNAFPCVASPDVQARIPRAAVNSQKVKVGVDSG